MKKDNFKTDTTIANEKAEAAELAKRIVDCTNRIPPKVLNGGSYQTAVTLKEHAASARKVAEGKQMNLGKLRQAWQTISCYYA